MDTWVEKFRKDVANATFFDSKRRGTTWAREQAFKMAVSHGHAWANHLLGSKMSPLASAEEMVEALIEGQREDHPPGGRWMPSLDSVSGTGRILWFANALNQGETEVDIARPKGRIIRAHVRPDNTIRMVYLLNRAGELETETRHVITLYNALAAINLQEAREWAFRVAYRLVAKPYVVRELEEHFANA